MEHQRHLIRRKLTVLLVIAATTSSSLISFAESQPIFPPKRAHIDFDLRTQEHQFIYSMYIRPILIDQPLEERYNPYFFQARRSPTNPNPELKRCYVLGQRRGPHFESAPKEWIELHLIFGDAPEEQIILYMAADDLYVLGYTNGTGQSFVFQGGFEGLEHLHPIELPFSESYGDLREGGFKKFWNVPLGRASAISATRDLARCNLVTCSKEVIAEALIKLLIMFPESIRFRAIRGVFSDAWDHVTFLTRKQVMYLGNYGAMSGLLIESAKYGTWGRIFPDAAKQVAKELKISTPEEALDKIDFVLRPLNEM